MLTFKTFLIEGKPSTKMASNKMLRLVHYDVDEHRRNYTARNKRMEAVPLDNVTHTQSKIANHKLAHFRQLVRNGKKLPSPHLVHNNGEYGIQDGHHRIEAAKREGHTHIMAHVVDVEEKE